MEWVYLHAYMYQEPYQNDTLQTQVNPPLFTVSFRAGHSFDASQYESENCLFTSIAVRMLIFFYSLFLDDEKF